MHEVKVQWGFHRDERVRERARQKSVVDVLRECVLTVQIEVISSTRGLDRCRHIHITYKMRVIYVYAGLDNCLYSKAGR